MPPPKTVLCSLCSQQFSAHSLPIHARACAAKRALSSAPCPSCLAPVDLCELPAHVPACRAALAALAASGGGGAAAVAAARAAAGARYAAATAAAEPPLLRLSRRVASSAPCDSCGASPAACVCLSCNAAYCAPCSASLHGGGVAGIGGHALTVPEPAELERLRLERTGDPTAEAPACSARACSVCERTFTLSRIAKHQLICARIAASPPRRSFATPREERLEGTEFAKFFARAQAVAAVAAARGAGKQEAVAGGEPGKLGAAAGGLGNLGEVAVASKLAAASKPAAVEASPPPPPDALAPAPPQPGRTGTRSAPRAKMGDLVHVCIGSEVVTG